MVQKQQQNPIPKTFHKAGLSDRHNRGISRQDLQSLFDKIPDRLNQKDFFLLQ